MNGLAARQLLELVSLLKFFLIILIGNERDLSWRALEDTDSSLPSKWEEDTGPSIQHRLFTVERSVCGSE